MRFLSIFLWWIHFYFCLKLLDQLQINDRFIRLFAVLMVSLLPSYVFISSVITNDGLILALGSALFYLMAKKRTLKNMIYIGLVLSLAFWTKFSAVFYLAMALMSLGLLVFKRELSVARGLSFAGILVFILTVLWGPWAARDWMLYGEIGGVKLTNLSVEWKSPMYGLRATLTYMMESFWAAAGIYNNVRFQQSFGVFFGYLIFLLGLRWIFQFRHGLKPYLTAAQSHIYVPFLVSVALIFIATLAYGYQFGQGQGRYLFIFLIPISLMSGFLIRNTQLLQASKNIEIHVTGFFAVNILGFMCFCLGVFSQL